MVETPLLFLVNPSKAQALASAVNLERRPALVASILMVLISGMAICFTAATLVNRPLEGFVNLAQLAAAALAGSYLVQKLRRVSVGLSEALKRLCVIVPSIVVVWIGAGVLLLSVSAISKLHVSNLGAAILELGFWGIEVGMLVHAFCAVSRTAAILADNARKGVNPE